MIVTIFVLSLLAGFCSGLLGVGGAVLLIPLLWSVPRLFGVGTLTMHEVSGVTMVQVLAASVAGYLAQQRNGFAHAPTVLAIGIPMGILSLAGATISKFMDGRVLLLIFGCLVVVALLLMVRRTPAGSDEPADFTFSMRLAVGSGCGVGLLSGIVGAGGGFILIPIMIGILHMPIRVAVGSSLGIVFIGALMGAMGKLITLQVEVAWLLPVLAGSLPASLAGVYVGKRVEASRLRQILLLLIVLVLIKVWYDIFVLFAAGR